MFSFQGLQDSRLVVSNILSIHSLHFALLETGILYNLYGAYVNIDISRTANRRQIILVASKFSFIVEG